MPSSLIKEILAWPVAIQGSHISALTGYLSGRLNRRLTQSEIDAALSWLSVRGLVELGTNQVRLSEPERPELELYDPLAPLLTTNSLLDDLGIRGSQYVFQKTAAGGQLGDGPLTRPDFTLAAIRSWRFDPRRTLEVFSFEVKNRGGATVGSVYEVVAHGRLVHHPYLVCPRSHLFPERMGAIRNACQNEGVGLIIFNIVQDGTGSFQLEDLAVDVIAERRSPDPFLIEKHLERRLTPENCDRLEYFARGVA